jgi:cytochrome P450 family 9
MPKLLHFLLSIFSRVVGLFGFMQKATLIVKDPIFIKKLMIADFDSFVNHDNNSDALKNSLFGKLLFFIRDQEWKDLRAVLSPMFTSSKMKYMFQLLAECHEDFLEIYVKRAEDNHGQIEVNTHDTFYRLTIDGISTALLGIKGDCARNPNSNLFQLAESMQEDLAGLPIKIYSIIPKVFKLLNLKVFRKGTEEFFQTFVKSEMKRRDEGNISRPDAIQLMLKLKKGELKMETGDAEQLSFSESKNKRLASLTDDDFAAQAMIFFMAGVHSNTTVMQGISFELAVNDDIQQTLIREVDEMLQTLDGNRISYDQLNGMKFLDMVVKEELRKWPPGRTTSRVCTKDYSLIDDETGRTYDIKKGTDILIPIMEVHMDPRYHKDPEKFDPYRFSDENKHNINDSIFLPFGIGPRHCMGNRFALLEEKLILFYILSKFSIAAVESTPKSLKVSKSLGFENEIRIAFKLRKV